MSATSADHPVAVEPGGAAGALAAADAAESDGRLWDAIELLTAQNLRERDLAIEQRLRLLRHRAFAQYPRDGGPDEWPPIHPDPFPGYEGVPEVTTDQLT